MKTMKLGVILLALLLVGLAMVPMVSAENPELGSADSGMPNTSANYPLEDLS